MAGRNNGETASQTGLGFVGALTIAFVVLKLWGVLDWAWMWVLAPIWISMLVMFGVFILVVLGGIVYVLASLGEARHPQRPRRAAPRPWDTSPHGPARKWGYRAADPGRTAVPQPPAGPPPSRPNVAGGDHSAGIWPADPAPFAAPTSPSPSPSPARGCDSNGTGGWSDDAGGGGDCGGGGE